MIADLDTPENSQGINFDHFLDSITAKLGNKETKDGIARIFDLFDDDKSGNINIHNLRRVAKELGETMSADELKDKFLYSIFIFKFKNVEKSTRSPRRSEVPS